MYKYNETRKFLFLPRSTGRKLSIHKTFRRRPGRLLNVLCTFNLRPVSRGYVLTKTIFSVMKLFVLNSALDGEGGSGR